MRTRSARTTSTATAKSCGPAIVAPAPVAFFPAVLGAGLAVLLPALSSLAVAGCAHAEALPPDPPVADYRVGSDDLLDVVVWKEPALSTTVAVRPDGKISVPMIGELAAAGRTTIELRDEIAQKLETYVPSPSVTVAIKEVRASRFFVLGEVAHPGAYPLPGTLTVIQAMALSGGPTEFAHLRRLVVLRNDPVTHQPQRIHVNLHELVDGRVRPFPLSAGDTLYVP